MSKHRKLSEEPSAFTPVTMRRVDDLVFARLSDRKEDAVEDMSAVLRAINGFREITGDRALDGQLKSRVAGKIMTLDNMANSLFYKRTPQSSKSACSKELVSSKSAKQSRARAKPASLTTDDLNSLKQMWLAYARAFFKIMDSVPESEFSDSTPSFKQKHAMIVTKFNIVGASIEVIDSPNSEIIGLSGTVVSEQENSLRVMDPKNKVRLIPKNVCTFRISVGERHVTLFGPEIAGKARTGSSFTKAPALLARQALHPLEYS